MGCRMIMVAAQMAVIVAVGTALGVADRMRRPVMVNAPEIAPLPAKPAATPADTPREKPEPAPARGPGNAPEAPQEKPAEVVSAPSNPPPASNPGEENIDPELVKTGHITVAQAFELFSAPDPAYFIDARRKDIFEAGHVRDAFRLPLEAFKGQEPAHLASMPRDGIYVVYCEGGNCDESVAVQKQLLLAAYTKVYVMHAGYPGWVQAGHPIGTGEDPIEAGAGRP